MYILKKGVHGMKKQKRIRKKGTRIQEPEYKHNRNNSTISISHYIRGNLQSVIPELEERTGKKYTQVDVMVFGLWFLMEKLGMEIPEKMRDPTLFEQWILE